MIPPDRHTPEWIVAQQARLGMADPIILEKAIFALILLDLLARTDLDFVFKGGTALLLHLPRPNRLSIDIDIVCSEPKPDFESSLDELLDPSPFLRWDEQTRGERGLPGRRHYRFHFQSPTQGQEMHILLDVITEPNVLIHLADRPVNTSFLDITEPITVKTPRLESLLADKLTAFAPGSIGVPLTAQFSHRSSNNSSTSPNSTITHASLPFWRRTIETRSKPRRDTVDSPDLTPTISTT